MKLKKSAIIALSVSAMLVFSGCSGGSTPEDTSTKPAAAADSKLNAMLPQEIRDAGELTVGISPSFYPNAYYPTGSETLEGIDPDLLNAMGEKLGVKIKFVTADFPSLVLGVNSGKFDIAMSDISDTAERQEQVSFVDYMQSYRMVFFPADNPKNISEDPLTLCGLSVPVVTSTLSGKAAENLSAACEAAGKAPIEAIPVQGHEAVQLGVDSGRADFGITAGSEGALFEKENPGKYEHFILVSEGARPSGVATQKDASELQQALLATFEALKQDGTYTEVFERYGLPESALDEFGINLG